MFVCIETLLSSLVPPSPVHHHHPPPPPPPSSSFTPHVLVSLKRLGYLLDVRTQKVLLNQPHSHGPANSAPSLRKMGRYGVHCYITLATALAETLTGIAPPPPLPPPMTYVFVLKLETILYWLWHILTC